MTDKMADQITESDQKRSNYGQCENNEECNDSFMSFLVYSFMKNMWWTIHFWDRPFLYFGTVHFHRWPSTYQSAYRHSGSKCPTLFPIFIESTNQLPDPWTVWFWFVDHCFLLFICLNKMFINVEKLISKYFEYLGLG